MWSIKQPSTIIFGKNSAKEFLFPKNCLVITSKGAKSRGWLEYAGLNDNDIFDQVESNPSLETVTKILSEFNKKPISNIIGLGGGSSLDVAKYVGFKLNKPKILIPTTFGSGSEVTRISVITVDGKKKSFHDDGLFADIAIVDSNFSKNSPDQIYKNSAIDACAQCTEGYDSKLGNIHTKFLCSQAFDLLEYAIMNNDKEKLALGSLIAGLGFGNCSTTLGHALSYVYSNEGYSHGHALAFTTTVSHKFNNSIFYQRFKNLVNFLNFKKIHLKQDYSVAADTILTDRKHLDNNPNLLTKQDIMILLDSIDNCDVD
jgi:malonic semialdehyde reductase